MYGGKRDRQTVVGVRTPTTVHPARPVESCIWLRVLRRAFHRIGARILEEWPVSGRLPWTSSLRRHGVPTAVFGVCRCGCAGTVIEFEGIDNPIKERPVLAESLSASIGVTGLVACGSSVLSRSAVRFQMSVDSGVDSYSGRQLCCQGNYREYRKRTGGIEKRLISLGKMVHSRRDATPWRERCDGLA